MSSKRFEVVEKQGKTEVFKVLRDNETGVLYLFHQNYMNPGSGLTVMVNEEGKPLVDEDFKKQ